MTKSTYKTGIYTIPPGGEISVQRAANYLICLEGSAPFKIRFNDGTVSDFEAGITLRQPDGFTKLEVVNPTQNPLAVTLGFGIGDVRDSRMTITGTLDTKVQTPPNFTAQAVQSVPAGEVSEIAAVTPTRAEIGLTNEGADKVWVRGDAVAAIAGQPIEAGQSVVLTTTAALYVFNPTGAPVDVASWQTEYPL